MNLMSVTSMNRRTIWFIKTFSFVLRFHFPKIASSGSSFGSERKPATLLLSPPKEVVFYHYYHHVLNLPCKIKKNFCFITYMQYISRFF